MPRTRASIQQEELSYQAALTESLRLKYGIDGDETAATTAENPANANLDEGEASVVVNEDLGVDGGLESDLQKIIVLKVRLPPTLASAFLDPLSLPSEANATSVPEQSDVQAVKKRVSYKAKVPKRAVRQAILSGRVTKRVTTERLTIKKDKSGKSSTVNIGGQKVGTKLREENDEDFKKESSKKSQVKEESVHNEEPRYPVRLRTAPRRVSADVPIRRKSSVSVKIETPESVIAIKKSKVSTGRKVARKQKRKPGDPEPPKKVKVQYSNKYGMKFGYSRFPAGTGPPVEQIEKVFDILREHHAKDGLRFDLDDVFAGGLNTGPAHASRECTIHAFVSTVLSQATSNEGALKVQWDLRYHFPFTVNGYKIMGKKPNYHDMRRAHIDSMIEILAPSGLQFKRAKVIKSILAAVYDMNQARGAPLELPQQDTAAILQTYFDNRGLECTSPGLTNADKVGSPRPASEPVSPKSQGDQDSDLSSPMSMSTELTIPDSSDDWTPPDTWELHGDVWEPPEHDSPDFFVPGSLSVDHLQSLPDQELFDELVSHDGIGMKTAACVMSFNLGRPVFAVDIHVFRLCKFLGWSPGTTREDRTCELLDAIIPNTIKYPLHQAFWHHGQKCGRCKSGATERSAGWEEGCPIEAFVDRSRFVPDMSKVQKEKQEERTILKAAKDKEKAAKEAEKKAKADARAEAKAEKDKTKASQRTLFQVGVDVQTRPKKRKADTAADGEIEPLDESQPGSQQKQKVKKVKVEDIEIERDPMEWGKVRVHDDFDAGRSQNVTKIIWVKIRKITIKWESE